MLSDGDAGTSSPRANEARSEVGFIDVASLRIRACGLDEWW